MTTRFERGMDVRRRVLGDAHVDAALASSTDLDADFQVLITEVAWGSLWDRPELDDRTRSLVTIALLAALGQSHELALHLRVSRELGVPEVEVSEAFRHVAVYAGIPAANDAFRVARQVFNDLGEDTTS